MVPTALVPWNGPGPAALRGICLGLVWGEGGGGERCSWITCALAHSQGPREQREKGKVQGLESGPSLSSRDTCKALSRLNHDSHLSPRVHGVWCQPSGSGIASIPPSTCPRPPLNPHPRPGGRGEVQVTGLESLEALTLRKGGTWTPGQALLTPRGER